MHLLNSLLSGLTPSTAGNPARDAGTGKAGGDFSGLLSLLAPVKTAEAAIQPVISGEAAITVSETAIAVPTEAGLLPTGSAMPPVAASGKILPALPPESLPDADIALAAEPSADATEPALEILAASRGKPAAIAKAEPAAPALPLLETDAGAAPETGALPARNAESEPPVQPKVKAGKTTAPVAVALKPVADSDAADETEESDTAIRAQVNPEALAIAVVLPVVAHLTARNDGEPAVEGEAANPAAPPASPRLPTALFHQASTHGEARKEHRQAAPLANGADAALPAGDETPTLTLRMAQREQAPATPADPRPAMAERPMSHAVAAQPARFAPVAEREAEPAKAHMAANSTVQTPAHAVPAAPAAPTDPIAPAAPVIRAQSHEPMTDLAQIVDRLAAAREALAPARAALSIDHAEFGELTLRFEQRHDGRLTAELAGANAEAHRAVSHALAADRSQTAGQDAGAQQQQQPQQQSQSQSLRASAGDRDAGGTGNSSNNNGNDHRQDSARQRGGRPADQHRPQSGKGQQQSGVFA